jgi:hypothetical protein
MNAPACARLFQPQHHYSSPSRKTVRRGHGNIPAPLRQCICRWRPGASRLPAAARSPFGVKILGRVGAGVPHRRAACMRRLLLSRPARRRGACTGRRAVARLPARGKLVRQMPARAVTEALCAERVRIRGPARLAGPLSGTRAGLLLVRGPGSGPPGTARAGPATVQPGTSPRRSGWRPRPPEEFPPSRVAKRTRSLVERSMTALPALEPWRRLFPAAALPGGGRAMAGSTPQLARPGRRHQDAGGPGAHHVHIGGPGSQGVALARPCRRRPRAHRQRPAATSPAGHPRPGRRNVHGPGRPESRD